GAPQALADVPVELDQAAERMSEELGDRGGERLDLDAGGLELLAAGEGEQAADQVRALLGGAAGHAEDLELVLVERDPPLDQAEAAEDSCEEVVEIVGDAAGELADRVHLARLDELAFQILAVGDVEQGAGIFDRLALRVAKQNGLVEEVAILAVGALPAIFDRERAAVAAPGEGGDDPVAVVRVEAVDPQSGRGLDLLEPVAGQGAEIAADQLGRARRGVERFEVKDDRKRLDDRTLPLLGEPKLPLGPKPLVIGPQIRVEQRRLGGGLALELLGHREQVDEHGD